MDVGKLGLELDVTLAFVALGRGNLSNITSTAEVGPERLDLSSYFHHYPSFDNKLSKFVSSRQPQIHKERHR